MLAKVYRHQQEKSQAHHGKVVFDSEREEKQREQDSELWYPQEAEEKAAESYDSSC